MSFTEVGTVGIADNLALFPAAAQPEHLFAGIVDADQVALIAADRAVIAGQLAWREVILDDLAGFGVLIQPGHLRTWPRRHIPEHLCAGHALNLLGVRVVYRQVFPQFLQRFFPNQFAYHFHIHAD